MAGRGRPSCAFSFTTGAVVFTFWAGDPTLVVVIQDDAGGLAAADPERVPRWMTP